LLALGAALVMLASAASPADAEHGNGGGDAMRISGDAVPSDCNDGRGAGALELFNGNLEGCLTFFPKAYTCEELNGFALYNEEGRERFRGTLDGKRGTFTTTYTIEATYTAGSCAEFDAGGFPFMNQLTGGCDHYVKGRRGVFRGATGLINFHDVIPEPGVSGASNFLYSGYLNLKG